MTTKEFEKTCWIEWLIRIRWIGIRLFWYRNRLHCSGIHWGGVGLLHGDGIFRASLYALAAEDAAETVDPPVSFFPIDGKRFGGAVFRAEGAEDTGRGIETDMAPGSLERSSRELWVHLAGGLPEEVPESGLEHSEGWKISHIIEL